MLNNLDIYFSAACNIHCSYCCAESKQNNQLIQNALANGSFAQKVVAELTPDIQSIGLWGMEPAVNADYFKNFIYSILDASSFIKYIFIPTNASLPIYYKFIKPISDYCKEHKRKIILEIQISFDGDSSVTVRHTGDVTLFARMLSNINEIVQNVKENKYFRCKLYNKSTLTAYDLYMDPEDWYFSLAFFESGWKDYENYSLRVNFSNPPTLAYPGDYSKEDGEELVKWGLEFQTESEQGCAAGITSKTIDYEGNIYDCHLLENKEGINKQSIRLDFDKKVDRLLQENQITETDKDRLWNAISNIYCWATGKGGMPESYIKLLGNGALKGD